ncbi:MULTISPECIES: LysE family translocator [Pasteurellaceae]|uniref:LysE family translocator n=1 Tax=Pasteurellaceae TaxID=712 RepID=UPI0035614959
MNTALLSAFWLVSFSMCLVPGIDWAYMMSAGLLHRVLPALAGVLLGYLLVSLLVMLGVGGVLVNHPFLMYAVNIAGALYLLYIAILAWRTPVRVQETQNAFASAKQWLLKGIVVSGFNPKVLLLFLAVIPQFMDQHAALNPVWQSFILGLIHMANCLLLYPMVGLGVGVALKKRPDYAQLFGRGSALTMLVMALWLCGEQVQKIFYFSMM